MTKELDIQGAICDWLDAYNFRWWRVALAAVRIAGGVRRRNPMTGHPDLAGVHRGRYFVIEVKKPGKAGNLSEAQVKWRDDLLASGALWILATSVQDVKLSFISAGFFDELP